MQTDAGRDAGFDAGVDAGNVFYVDPVNGDDLNPGTSPAGAWKSLGKASSTPMIPGAQVLVKAGEVITGTTSNRIAPVSGGQPGKPIFWGRYGGDGGRPVITGDGGVHISLVNVNWVTITGFEIRNSPTFAVFTSNAGNIVLEDLFIHDVGEGIHPTITNVTSDITVRNSTIRRIRFAADGGGQPRGISLTATSLNWRIENTEISDTDSSCASDLGSNSVFDNVRLRDCGQEGAGSDRSGLMLRGSNAVLKNSRIERATGDCLQLSTTDGGTLVLNNVLQSCDNCIGLSSIAAGDVTLRRNVASGCNRLVSQGVANPRIGDLLYVNNTFVAGLADGGPTAVAVVMRPGRRGVFENNIIAGNAAGLFLNVQSGWDAGFVERGNAYQSDAGDQFSWDSGDYAYAAFVVASGVLGGSFQGAASFLSVTDFHLDAGSAYRSRGVANPASGSLAPGCDAGFDVYCGTAPEPGAYELIP